MSNLNARIDARNKAEKFFCNRIYPTVTSLFIDLAERAHNGEKLFLTSGAFSKVGQALVDNALEPLRADKPENVRFYVTPETSGVGTFAQIRLKFSGAYTRPSKRGESVDYVKFYVPTLYLYTVDDISRYKTIAPPFYSQLTSKKIEKARAEYAALTEKLRDLESKIGAAKIVLSEVGEA